jgi:hypothetical protein
MTDNTKIVKRRRPRKRRCDSKYKEKYTAELISGIRYIEGLSKIELCHRWRISETGFDKWLDSVPEFAEAYELSKSDYATYWHEINKKTASGEMKGNAGCIVFALTNIEKIRWSSRVEVNSKSEQTIGAININILEAPIRGLARDAIDGEIIPEIKKLANVVNINDK